MTKKHSTKRSLIASILVLCLCLTSFIGTTFAWFTDSVTSSGNIIKSGTLKVGLSYADGAEDPTSAAFNDASVEAIFDYDNWEPGYTDAKHVKISNNGSLALKYQFAIVPVGEVSKLAEVIDVYYVSPAVQASRDSFSEDDKLGTLAEVINKGIAVGNLAAGKSDVATIVLKMQESAGNEYQGLSIGDSFKLVVFATQLMAEEDSFGKDYDEGAIIASTAAEAQAALDNAAPYTTIYLVPGVDYGTLYMRPYAGGAATKDVDWIGNNYGWETYTCFENVTIVGAEGATVDAVEIEGGTYYHTEHSQDEAYPVMLSLVELKNVTFEGVTFTGKGGYDPQGHGNAINLSGGNIKVDGLTLENCVLESVGNNARLLYKTESTTHKHTYAYEGATYTFLPSLKDITVTECTINGDYMGLELRETENLTITNNTFNVGDRNILLPTNTGCTYSGTITITGNVSNNAQERFVRADGMGDAEVIIKDNVINNYMGADVDYIKVTNANNVTIANNTVHPVWNGAIPSKMPETLVVDTASKTISINDIHAFAYLNTLINSSDFFDKYGAKWMYSIELNVDVDLAGHEWTPIVMSNFVGFDGKGHTISNLKITSGADDVGLFGKMGGSDLSSYYIKNITIDGAYVKGGNRAGALVGHANCIVENATVLNATVEAGKYIGGLAGRVSGIKNCTIKDSTVVASDKTVGGLVGYCIADPGIGSATGNTVENVTVTGTWNVGGAFGQAQNVIVDGNTVKNVTVISTKALPADADDNEVRTAEVAARSAFANTTIGSNTVENVACGVEVYGLTLLPNGENSKIIVNDKEGFLNITKLFADWRELFTDGNGNEWINYANGAGVDYYYGGYWTISLEADIDLNNATIAPVTIHHPVNAGEITFNGNNHTIKNAKIVADATAENMTGLFNVTNEAFKNLKLDNIHVTGSNVGNSNAGILAGYCSGRIDNITITNSSVTGGKYTGGVVGSGYTDISNCTLTNVTVKGGYKLGGIIGYICAETGYTHNVTGNTLTDCTVDGIGGGVFAGGKTEYVIGKIVGNYNCNGDCKNNTVTNMITSATENIGKIEAGKIVNQ